VATALGLESMSGYESIVPNRTITINRVLAGEQPDHALDVPHFGAYLPSFFASVTRYDLLARFGVTTIYAPPDIAQDANWDPVHLPIRLKQTNAGPEGRIFELEGVQPRAYVVHSVERVDGPRAALRRFSESDIDYRRAVIHEPAEAGRVGTTKDSPVETMGLPARVLEIGTNRESYEVDSAAPGWLVVTNMWDPGWRATVNGEEAEVLRANYNQWAVRVPTGRARVELEYRPRGLEAGTAITAATLLAPVVVFSVSWGRRWRARARRRLTGAVV